MPCIFCEIAAGRSPAEILYENEKTIAFLDIRPIHAGHTLVVPKTHYEQTIEIPDEELLHVVRGANAVAAAIMTALKPDGYNIFTSNGKAAGQSVFHVHFHVTPRYHNDGIRFHLQLQRYGKGEMQRMAERLRGSLRAG